MSFLPRSTGPGAGNGRLGALGAVLGVFGSFGGLLSGRTPYIGGPDGIGRPIVRKPLHRHVEAFGGDSLAAFERCEFFPVIKDEKAYAPMAYTLCRAVKPRQFKELGDCSHGRSMGYSYLAGQYRLSATLCHT